MKEIDIKKENEIKKEKEIQFIKNIYGKISWNQNEDKIINERESFSSNQFLKTNSSSQKKKKTLSS